MVELKKSIGFMPIFALLVTSLIGTGLFFAPAIAAGYAGTASIISWIIMFLISIYMAFCFGELVSTFPNAGGVYEYSKKAYGRFPSFMLGWITWLVNTINTPLLIVAALTMAFPGLNIVYFVLLSIAIIVFLNYVAYRGLKDSAILLYVFAFITLGVILTFIFKAVPVFKPQYIFPLTTTNNFMILVAIFFLSESFYGWTSATFLAEETKNAEKIIPRALVLTTLIVGTLSVIVAILSLGIIPFKELISNSNYFSMILATLFNPETAKYFTFGIFALFLGSASGNIISSPRLLLAMARDKLFIEQFADIHEKQGTPYKAIIFQTIVSIILIFISLGNYRTLLSLIIPLCLLMFISMLIALPILRKKYPGKQKFKAPLVNILPFVVALMFLLFIITWLVYEPNALSIIGYALGFIIFGLPVYLLLNIYYNPEFTIKINESFSYLNLWLENILFPKKIRRFIMSLFTDYKNKKILEFGSGVGSLTMYLAEEVGSDGKVFAIDFSRKNLNILNKRMIKKGHFHVEILHDKHITSRVHPSIKNVDMVFSVGLLGYIQNLKKILEEFNDLLPEGGKICLIEYVDYFHLIPNPKYISNKVELIKLFNECGFSIKIKKIKGTLWNYSLIYGMKTSNADAPFI